MVSCRCMDDGARFAPDPEDEAVAFRFRPAVLVLADAAALFFLPPPPKPSLLLRLPI